MASKRNIRRKQCEGKIKFIDQAAAEKAAHSHQKQYGRWMTAYHCSFCSKYHIGHPPKHVRAAIHARQARRAS